MPKQEAYDNEMGKKFQKPDIERIGLFVEMPYLHGAKYIFQKVHHFEGKTFLPSGAKSRTGTQHGYFDAEFLRLFEGEAINWRKNKKGVGAQATPTAPFVVGYRGKHHSTPGDHHGTFTGVVEAFGYKSRPRPPYKSEPIGFLTSPGKKGGCGYADICIDKYPEHISDRHTKLRKPKPVPPKGGPMVPVHFPQPYFDDNPYRDDRPNAPTGTIYHNPPPKRPHHVNPAIFVPVGPAKWKGGCQAGCFDKFPEFMKCKYVPQSEANRPTITSKGPIFPPQSYAEKSMYTRSVVSHNVDLRVNTGNYRTFEPTYTKYLL